MSEYTVGAVARMSGVTVRTLHHYDEIGLLSPRERTAAGYRLYSAADLQRLRRILFYRELDFELSRIAEMLSDGGGDRGGGNGDGGGKDDRAGIDEHLRRQHALLRERRARTDLLLRAIEHEMEARKMGISLTPEEQLEVFGTDGIEEYQREARERWGDTGAFKESQRRSAAYTKEDWIEIKRQADKNTEAFATAIRAGEPADGEVAMGLAEVHRQHISRWFYDCSHQMHRSLGDLYVSDARYSEPYEKIAPGFSASVRDAIVANAARLGS